MKQENKKIFLTSVLMAFLTNPFWGVLIFLFLLYQGFLV